MANLILSGPCLYKGHLTLLLLHHYFSFDHAFHKLLETINYQSSPSFLLKLTLYEQMNKHLGPILYILKNPILIKDRGPYHLLYTTRFQVILSYQKIENIDFSIFQTVQQDAAFLKYIGPYLLWVIFLFYWTLPFQQT